MQVLAGLLMPFLALSDLAAARFAVMGAPDDEGLLTCDVPAADTDPVLGVPDADFDEGDTALLAPLGSQVEIEVAAAVLLGAYLMLDVTGGAEGRVKTATTGKQVVARALMPQATVGARVQAILLSPFFLP